MHYEMYAKRITVSEGRLEPQREDAEFKTPSGPLRGPLAAPYLLVLELSPRSQPPQYHSVSLLSKRTPLRDLNCLARNGNPEASIGFSIQNIPWCPVCGSALDSSNP
jgi:hypothetical protein